MHRVTMVRPLSCGSAGSRMNGASAGIHARLRTRRLGASVHHESHSIGLSFKAATVLSNSSVIACNFCTEFVTTPCFFHFVGRLGIDAFKRQLNHKNTTLTSLPLNSVSSSFFHSCLCFTAALMNSRACSFVFLASIILIT